MALRLRKREQLSLVISGRDDDDVVDYSTDGRLFDRRFNDQTVRPDWNGDYWGRKEIASYFVDESILGETEDGPEYYFSLSSRPFGAVPIDPYVYPRTTEGDPVPLNRVPRFEDVRGGGYSGRGIPLESICIRGVLRVGCYTTVEGGPPNYVYDECRILVVFDLAPVVAGGVYQDPCGDLFVDTNVNGRLGIGRSFKPQALSRFRVLHDEVFSARSEIMLDGIDAALRHIDVDVTSLAHKVNINPDNNELLILNRNQAAESGVSTTTTAGTFNFVSGGILVGEVSEGTIPSVAFPVPMVGTTDNLEKPAIDSYSMIAVGGEEPVPTNFLGVPNVQTVNNVAGLFGSLTYIHPAQDVAQHQVFPGSVPVNIVVDLAERNYFTLFTTEGHIKSGAIWMICVSTNANTYLSTPHTVDADPYSFVSSTLYYTLGTT